MRLRPLTILEVFDDANLSGGQFVAASWRPWRGILGVIFNEPCSEAEASLARSLSGRQDVLDRSGYREATFVIGRRAGKSKILAFIAYYLACFVEWKSRLSSGEVGVIMILAADRDQAGVILGYVKGFLSDCRLTSSLVTNEGVEQVTIGTRRVSIEVHTSNYRSPRGRTVIAVLCDELAFWKSETSANPAEETIRALRPSLLTLAPDSRLIMASSPYARHGLLWTTYTNGYGREGSKTLVLQASSTVMNPSLDRTAIADALAEDPEGAAAEWLAEFRRDVVRFVSPEVIAAAVIPGRHELPRAAATNYRAFLDPSGGSADSFTLAIGHRDGDLAVLDLVRETKPPFSPDAVAADFASVMKSYGITRATSDKYAGIWPVEVFYKHGIVVEQCARPKSDLYGELLPGLNSGRVALLDNPTLLAQLGNLERRTSRAGRDAIDHPVGQHDDIVNCVAGVLVGFLGRAVAKIDFAAGVIMAEPVATPGWGDARDFGNMEDLTW